MIYLLEHSETVTHIRYKEYLLRKIYHNSQERTFTTVFLITLLKSILAQLSLCEF